MAEPIVRLEPTRVSVEPGGQVTVLVTVFNPDNVVEGYDVDVVSTTPMPWATASPDTLSVYPQQEATTVVTFSPPAGSAAQGGSFPFGVRLRSQVDAERTAVAEGDLDIGTVSGLQASLTPVTSSGRWRGSHTLEVRNWGNSAARLRVTAQDPDQALGFLVSPSTVEVPIGGQGYARVKVRTRHPVLRGTNQRLPFQVVCEPDEPSGAGGPHAPMSTPERPVVDGAFNQKPILTRMVVLVAGLLLLALVGLVLWLFLRPDKNASDEGEAVVSAPVGLTAAQPSPGTVLLTWAAAQGVDSYEVLQTKPESVTRKVTALVDPADPAKYLVRLKVETADEYCYQLRALRESGDRSAPSPEECVRTTLVGGPGAEPTASPTEIQQLPPAPGEQPVPSGGAQPSPTTSAPTTAPPTSPGSGTDAPLPFMSVLKFYDGDPTDVPPGAEADRAALNKAGFPAKLVHTSTVSIQGLPGDGWVLYLDAATAEELTGDCDAIVAAQPPGVSLTCSLSGPRPVSPVSTATPGASL